MSLTCSITNEVPQEPVVSPSGHIFERRVVERYIMENGTDPISGEPLTIEQLIHIKVDPIVKPRTTQATSIPALLKMMQDEWDAVMLQSFAARKQAQIARQELSHALYMKDAAERVIARLERDNICAREALATLKSYGMNEMVNGDTGTDNGIIGDVGISEEVMTKLVETSVQLTAQRKTRSKTLPEGYTTVEEMKRFTQIQVQGSLHEPGTPQIRCLDVLQGNDSVLLTGGADANVVMYDRVERRVTAEFKGHSKRVNRVAFHKSEPFVLSCSRDTNIIVWSAQTHEPAGVLRRHTREVTDISMHPTGDYILSGGLDGVWAFHDMRAGRTMITTEEEDNVGITRAAMHPDGIILSTGNEASVCKMWDLKDQSCVCTFSGHTNGSITAIAFSENGYYLATAAEDQTIKLWDLRKLANFKTIELESNVNDLCFDYSGTYLAAAGNDVRVYLSKQWSEVFFGHDHTDIVTGVRFGDNAAFVASVGHDRMLRIYGLHGMQRDGSNGVVDVD